MAAWRYEISLLVLKKYFTRSLRSLVKYFSTLEEKFRISARPCNILYLFATLETRRGLEPKCIPQLFLGSLLVKHQSIFSSSSPRSLCGS